MNEQEMNEKLAEWAGFERIPDWEYDPNMPAHWRRGNDWFMIAEFTRSLDACFKWLVPKLDYAIINYGHNRKTIAWVELAGKPHSAEAETASLALCEAIIKLLKKEKK